MKNIILKGVTWIAALVLITSMCCMDSEDLSIPLIAFGVSGAWLSLFGYVNCRYNGNGKER